MARAWPLFLRGDSPDVQAGCPGRERGLRSPAGPELPGPLAPLGSRCCCSPRPAAAAVRIPEQSGPEHAQPRAGPTPRAGHGPRISDLWLGVSLLPGTAVWGGLTTAASCVLHCFGGIHDPTMARSPCWPAASESPQGSGDVAAESSSSRFAQVHPQLTPCRNAAFVRTRK